MKLTSILETDWTDKSNKEPMAEVLRVLDRTNNWPQPGEEYVTWAAPQLVGQLEKSSLTCKMSIINILAIITRTNVFFFRCGI